MGLCNISYNDKLFLNVYHPQLYHSKHVNLTIVVTSGVELNVLNRLFSLHTHAAQTLQMTRGLWRQIVPWDGQAGPSRAFSQSRNPFGASLPLLLEPP